jgi:putative PEP-CTERM system TPR-repeat lipoprotein
MQLEILKYMEGIVRNFYLVVILGVLLVLMGCSKKTSDEYIALAEKNIQQNNIPIAIIELKNAISVNPQDPIARFMLGNLYASRGSSQAAEKELLQASELGYEPNKVLPLLVNVYSLQFKNAEIIKLVDGARGISSEVATTLLLYKAIAHFQLGEPYNAKKAVVDANEISADSLYSKLGNAYVDFSNKQIDTSLDKLNEILKEQPDFADGYLLKGQLTAASNDKNGSVKSFEKYKSLLPNMYESRVFLANAYIKNNQFEEAEKEVDLLLKANPEQPFVNQLKGTVRFQAQDFSNAKLYIEKAIQNGLGNVPNRIIAGISAFRLGTFEQAYKYLYSIKDSLPSKHPILKILAILELKLGAGSETGLLLTSLDGLTEDDILLLSAASAQLMREGRNSQQQAILDQVNSIEFSDPLRMAQRGMLRLSLDDIEGLTDLEQALLLDPAQNMANTALARAYINNRLYDEALALSRTWIQQKPEEVNGYILAAVSHIKLKEIDLAEDLYNQVLTLDPNNIAANTYYADKAVLQGNQESAITYLTKIINIHTGHIRSLRKHFVLQRELGNAEDGLKPIVTAFEQTPEKIQFRLLYAQALLTQGQYTQSISVLEQIMPNDSSPNMYWIVLGNAYFFNQQRDKATVVAKSWISAQPNNKDAHLRLIALQDIAKNNSEALNTAKLAQQRFPTEAQFSMLTTYFNIVTGDIKAAESSYGSLPENVQNSVAGQGLLGQIFLEKGDVISALPKLKAFYEQNSSQANATLVAKTLKALKQYSQAIAFLQAHQKKIGKSVTNDVQIAELAIFSDDYELAAEQYISVLVTEPDNIRALNNLAFILIEQGHHQQALQYAKRAVELSPDYPATLDTYATALFKTGQIDEAVGVFDKVYNYDRSNTGVALRYAEALIVAKQIKKAKTVLNLLKSNDPALQIEIQRLKLQIE